MEDTWFLLHGGKRRHLFPLEVAESRCAVVAETERGERKNVNLQESI